MTGDEFDRSTRAVTADAHAPDGSEVRILCATRRGGMAEFSLQPGQIAKAVAHRTVDEIWYVLGGIGRIWRASAERSDICELSPGLCLSIPVGVRFQFRCDGHSPLVVLGVTMPPWPGPEEAMFVEGKWEPTAAN